MLSYDKRQEDFTLPIIYNKNILDNLKSRGFTTYRIRKEKLLSESTLQKLREDKPITTETIAILCKLLDCQPGDIMEYIPDK